MSFRNLSACVDTLEAKGQLVKIENEVDPYLEMAAIHRRVFNCSGPAVFYTNVKGSQFPAVSNLFGTEERINLLFKDAGYLCEQAYKFRNFSTQKILNPANLFRLRKMLPKRKRQCVSSMRTTDISQLPHIQSWSMDGGAYILLPQVYSESILKPGWQHSNIGCYRIQMSGNDYIENRELGLHFQIHRGIGNHFAEAAGERQDLKVSVFVGGPPSHIIASIFPLPEGIPELAFAGLLNKRRFNYCLENGYLMSCDADFVIIGDVGTKLLKPEGPFGDHLGYYSKQHLYPVIHVKKVLHRKNAIWPFTIVGRPPQEDSLIGEFIHSLVGNAITEEIPGLHQIHAVDLAGVHPLLLAIGSERYEPFSRRTKPGELLTIANHILGTGQLSLAKYLFISAKEDNPGLKVKDVIGFLMHMLERVDWEKDLHFYTNTTIDTLDYTGTDLNQGSKLVVACVGEKRRSLSKIIPGNFKLPDKFVSLHVFCPGILVITGPKFKDYVSSEKIMKELGDLLFGLSGFPLVVVTEDSQYTAASEANFLWQTFTRSDPSRDIYGGQSSYSFKHWGCKGPLIIDARKKPQHASALENDPEVERKVDELGAPGQPLFGII